MNPKVAANAAAKTPARQRQSRAEASAGGSAPPALAHIVIECVTPELDAGRYAVKRVVGDVCRVGADVFKEGHDLLAARVRFRGPGDRSWSYTPLTHDPNADRWTGAFALDRIGRWSFTVEAWTDVFRTWRSGFAKKINAGVDVSLELLEGAEMIDAAVGRAKFGRLRSAMEKRAKELRDTAASLDERGRSALADDLAEFMQTHLAPRDLTTYERGELSIAVDREGAAFAAWYELFPRSATDDPTRHGTFADAEQMLPRIAELGFDVVYLPPIHPIGRTFRKGKNNTLTPEPDDVGSPWAIGAEEGGHTAVHPDLGTVEDFERFVRRANELGLEVALDYALQCAPDHPWVKEHPDWFHVRPDGSIMYAENPPKKYQDIYPINFWTEDREALWNACRDVFLFWMERGVRTFRVDNPHTKPFAFWEWVIAEVKKVGPDVVFLSEAFTKPKKLLNLAKLGFTQSYTYFTWKNTAFELQQWMMEFSQPERLEYHRGNLFANTPDILHEFLQHGGRPAFRLRLLLAATLSPLYGIYSGYELSENVPVREGSEEYLNSEKYEIRPRDFDAPGNLNDDVRRLNRVRRQQAALQRADNLAFCTTENPRILCYLKSAPDDTSAPAAAPSALPDAESKTTAEALAAADTEALDAAHAEEDAAREESRGAPAGNGKHPPRVETDESDLLVVVNLNPFTAEATMVHVPVVALGMSPDESYVVEDLLTGARYTWRGVRNYVHLDPNWQPGHLFRIHRPGGRSRRGRP
ncbi:MAG TPA: alpha-1,4-glucan--maltose-1-phosphate maltosyltransferase [Gemmatimonadaceae bacterium]|nr:alpha-1,4-glucan--maltose-1-phosphate maltosyltransferase [Gemmatimonadaceae bacterium]